MRNVKAWKFVSFGKGKTKKLKKYIFALFVR